MSSHRFFPAILFVASTLHAQQPLRDAPPPDVGQLLQALRAIRDQQALQKKSQREKVLRQVEALAASPSAAAAAWEDAVRQIQFEGVPKEGAAFRQWKDGPGDALSEKECQSALQLYFRWLALTLQRANGAKTRDLLPAVVKYTRDLQSDQEAMDNLDASMKRDAELAKGGKRNARDNRKDDQQTRRMHDEILRSLAGSPPVKALGIDDLLDAESWEMNPGNLDGIYGAIVLPELRALRDSRVLDYWDLKIQRAGEKAQKTKLAFEIEKFNTETRPQLLWKKAQEYVKLGLGNRAMTEMFTILKTYPTHPNASQWIGELETLIAPPAPAPLGTEAPELPAAGGAAGAPPSQ